MSWNEVSPPHCTPREDRDPCLTHVLTGAEKDLGGFRVRRVLPDAKVRRVGPFLFLDHFGPAQVPAGGGMNVRPHPHIHLATITYLLEGAVLHRDSLGSVQRIEPGAINLMVAGRGIVHSERTPDDLRDRGFGIHGLQLWIALPRAHEDTAPTFSHHPAETLPLWSAPGVSLRLLVGRAFGLTSPVPALAPLFYVDVCLEGGASVGLPTEAEYTERAAYIVAGGVRCAGEEFGVGQLLVFRAGGAPRLEAVGAVGARLVLLGGAPLDGERRMWWNFVSSDPLRIEAAKRDWKAGRFPPVHGDTEEFIPLPEEPPHILHHRTAEGGTFLVFQQGEPLGELVWQDAEGAVMDVLHTRVGEALQGKGWARRLVDAAVAWARQNHWTILPRCPYARRVILETPVMSDILTPGWEARLAASPG